MKRRYRRYFVILEEEDKGFSNSKSEGTKGYGKIEVRNEQGTLSLYCQNLKKLEEKKESYRLYLIQTKDTLEPTIVDIGPIKLENNGKGEVIWQFNAENVKGFKKSIEDFDTLALVVETLEESQRVIAPLVGYIHKEKSNWKPLLQKKLFITTKGKEEKVLEQPKEKSEEKPEEKLIKVDEKIEKPVESKGSLPKEEKPVESKGSLPKEERVVEPKKSLSKEEKVVEPKESLPKEEKVVEPKESLSKEEKPVEQEKDKEIKEKLEKKTEDHPAGSYSFQQDYEEIHPLQKYIENTLKVFPRVEPFDTNLKNYEWWQISYNIQTIYRAYMPFISHIEMMISPYYYHYPYYSSSEYQRQFCRYQHYIFGVCYDEKRKAKYYVYGIPGKRIGIEQPYKGTTGFVYWRASHYEQFKQEDFGYWLMHINAETGKVEKPLEATEISS
ncbi:hypothetical protein SAMN05446037_101087 [Anaerovirgula multivorans]|uniref:DUF7922 domain-containing protein n=1 Tax=Anaerovirgula multivorans TaxID=312168 RepID=A0A239EKA1_9FIRM|nr:hypothetical protein [Anaerovirgula multivorans]SNS45190.1 hypothetical protein SAMN05446037_101087 [Anaerovirgula multivorans]